MEAIMQPLQVVRSLYAARSEADGEDFGVKARFSALMADPHLGAQVPVLTEETAELLPNQCLVRFRGLVQDMLNPEYYMGEFRRQDGTWVTAKYADQLDEALPQGGHGSDRFLIAERRPLLLMPVPGESSWAAAPRAAVARASLAAVVACAAGGSGGAASAAKRPRDDGGAVDSVPSAAAAASVAGGESMSISVMVSDATGQTTADDGDSAASRARFSTVFPAQQPPAGGQVQGASSGAGADLPPGCCMAYVYGEEEVKLNDVVEVVGVMSRVPELAAAHLAAGGQERQAPSMLLNDLLAAHLPTSKVPRLHAILLSTEGAAALPQPPAGATAVAEARARVLGFLSQVLGGDDVAAEYLLLQLVGRVHHRTAEAAIGLLVLNLVADPNSAAASAAASVVSANGSANGGMPGGQQPQHRLPQGRLSALGGAVAAALGALAPRCVALPLSIPALNCRPWWPRRDLNSQRLLGGPLQLAADTQLVLDEAVMAAGTLSEVGLRNLTALQALMARQRVAYDFEFFSLDQPTASPVTVVSLGRSLLKDAVDVAVPLRPTAPLADAGAVAAAVAGADLAPLRTYLVDARAADFAIAPDMEAFLQQELVGARQKDREVTEQTFHTWMNLARLLALSYGEAGLSRERWAAMQALEARRQQRLVGTA